MTLSHLLQWLISSVSIVYYSTNSVMFSNLGTPLEVRVIWIHEMDLASCF